SMKSPYYSPEGCAQIGCWTYDRHARELNDRPDAEVKHVLVKEIQRYMPHMPDTPLFTEIYRWREAVCIAPPGMLGGIAHLKRNNYRDVKGLYLAGEYLHMPSVESAAKSGIDAARAALR
ncbi:MAG TPA: FAD-dependent oxidoreductase, partial [Deltaproteobacteria bacterium]|nr:FAD-dependent oxidoreductase [Deltaproteobacteria bacterium]